ncbi:MAG TPA: hypothetical protein PLA50_00805 [Bacteroidia bacterium]|nr:hypothetical protein [Bacteroidia bacterium]
MSDKLNQCILRFEENLKSAETYLTETKDHLTAAVKESADELETRTRNAMARLETRREQAAEAKEKILHYLEEKKDELITKLEDWRVDREIEKLERTADAKEEHAVNAVIAAAYALLEAEAAVLDALKARKIAVEVAG